MQATNHCASLEPGAGQRIHGGAPACELIIKQITKQQYTNGIVNCVILCPSSSRTSSATCLFHATFFNG